MSHDAAPLPRATALPAPSPSTPSAPPGGLRRATPADAGALAALRAVMFAAMGSDVGPEDAAWRTASARWYAGRLADRAAFAAYVVEDPADGVVASAVGAVEFRAPGPGNPTGVRGHVSTVCTLEPHRRRGHARACLEALLDWFLTGTAARTIDLNATAHGLSLYRDLGFVPPRFEALQLRIRS
jgi:GNAT superfamily N-acetyltransferase